jgi:hypothetical protein
MRPAARALAVAALAFAFAGGAWAALPTAQSIQSAYDDARVDNAERHQFDLVIEDAKCSEIRSGGYACQIDFVRRTEPDKRLYFDVVTVDQRDGRWKLLQGLCVKASR